MTSISYGQDFNFLPNAEGPAAEFRQLMTSGKFRQALITWGATHADSDFGRSQTGFAVYAYLLKQNEMPISGVSYLFQNTSPKNINPQMLKIWTTDLNSSVLVQKGLITVPTRWKGAVPQELDVPVIRNARDVKDLWKQIARTSNEAINVKARLLWAIATQASLLGDVKSSINALNQLRDSKQTVFGADLIASTYGRVLYQKGDLDGALAEFLKVPKSSTLWTEALEERAWTHLRRNDYAKATGDITTLMAPPLSKLVGPESYFLANLTSFKICDYPRLFKTSELFKQRHRGRLKIIEDLSQKGLSPTLSTVLDRFDQQGVSVEAAGPLIDTIPRGVLRDRQFVRAIETRRQWLSDIKKMETLKGAMMGPQEALERMNEQARRNIDQLRQAAAQRTREVAKTEVKEYRVVLNKLHLLEGQVIERLHVDENLKGPRNALAKADDKGEVLVFPYEGNEIWFDELDNFKARVKDCPGLKGAQL